MGHSRLTGFQIGLIVCVVCELAGLFIGLATQIAHHANGSIIGALIGAAVGVIVGGITWSAN